MLEDPYFGVTVPIDVTKAYDRAKDIGVSFFSKYLHDCMRAINETDNLRYRIKGKDIVDYDVIHASPTLMRSDNTFGFSFIRFDEQISIFADNIYNEKERIEISKSIYPDYNGLDCIHCSVLPWFKFSGHKEARSGQLDSVPKLAFSKTYKEKGNLMMNIAINANHALVDGYHVGLFMDRYQTYLNE